MNYKSIFVGLSLCASTAAYALPFHILENSPTVVTFSSSAAAVFQPVPEELWVVSTRPQHEEDVPLARIRQLLNARDVEVLDVPSGSGVRFVFSRARHWSVQEENKGVWSLQVSQKPSSSASLLSLKDRLVPPFVAQDVLDVRSKKTGTRLRVALAADPIALSYDYQLPQGVLVPSLLGLAMSEGQDMYVDGSALAFVPNPEPLPEIPVIAQELTEEPLALNNENDLFFEDAFASTDVSPARLDIHIDDVHDPRKAVPFTLPQGYGRPKISDRQRQYVQAFGAVTEALHKVDLIAGPEDSLPDNVSRSAILKKNVFFRRLSMREGRDFSLIEAEKLAALNKAQSGSEKIAAALELARIYVAFERYDEAEGVIRLLPADDAGVPKDMMARAFLGALMVLQDRPKDALALLESVEGIEPHLKVWLGMAQIQNQQYDKATDNLDALMDTVSLYPPKVSLKLRLLEGKMLLETLQYQKLFERMDALATGPNGDLPPLAEYYMAVTQLELGAVEDGRRMLAHVAETPYSKVSIRAKVDFILDMARSRDLLNPQVIMFLEDLRFLWRGDEVEALVLRELGRRYIQENKFRYALDRLKTYAVAFPSAPDMENITQLMREAFVKVFDPENRYLLDDLGLLSMYFDFRELTPATAKGDRLVERVASVLDGLLLYHRATELFERQLKYRVTDPIQQAKLGIELAGLYRKNERPYDALVALDKWVDVNAPLSTDMRRQYALERGKDLLLLGRYDEAKEIMVGWLDDKARAVQVDIAWEAGDYATVARLLSQLFDTQEHAGLDELQGRTNFVRLVYALAQLKEQDALTQLLLNYKEELKDNLEVADIVNVYASDAKIHPDALYINTNRPLEQITRQILELNRFEGEYQKKLAQQAERRQLREIYNQKQDYMDYLRQNGLL